MYEKHQMGGVEMPGKKKKAKAKAKAKPKAKVKSMKKKSPTPTLQKYKSGQLANGGY